MPTLPPTLSAILPMGSRFRRVPSALALIGALLAAYPGFAGVFYSAGTTTLHFAFDGSPNRDRPIIRPPAIYHADDGFGFVDSPDLVGTAQGVMAAKYFRFDVNLPAGTYQVTLVFGGTPGESITSVKAEGEAMVQDVHITHGQTATKTFTVTVKSAANGGAPLEADGRLTLEFVGTNPSLMKLDIKPAI